MATWRLLVLCLVVIGFYAQNTAGQIRPPNQIVGPQPSPTGVQQIRRELFYPHKKEDRLDSITALRESVDYNFKFNIPFYGFAFNYTWIMVHGVISFSNAFSTLKFPFKFPVNDWPNTPDPAFIGPFFAKAEIGEAKTGIEQDKLPPGVYIKTYLNIGTSRDINYQEEIDLKEALRQDIQDGMVGAADFIPKHVVIITWQNMTFQGSIDNKKTNSYQMVITTDEVRTYIIYNYKQIDWISSVQAGGNQDGFGGNPAFIGFNAGNGTSAFEYKPYSQTQKATDLPYYGGVNGHPGRHMFRVDEEIIQGSCNFEPDSSIPTLNLSPESGHMLGGTLVNITGPCFPDSKSKNIKVKFHDYDVTCVIRNRNLATCISPRLYIVGYIEVSILQSGRSFSNKFYIENPMVAVDHIKFEDTNVIDGFESTSISMMWSWQNLTYNFQHPVSISLWGYREYAVRPEIEYITTLAETTNNGEYNLDLTQFANRDDGWKREFLFGFIMVNTTLTLNQDRQLTPVLWSSPIPLAWYFQPQWVRFYGKDWAAKFCDQWDTDDRRLRNFAHQVHRCPCTAGQAYADKGRFTPDFGCDKFGNSECYGSRKILTCFRSGQPSADGAGQQCCYGHENDLIMNADMKEGGTPSRSHPFGFHPYDESTKVPGLSHWYHDRMAYYVCCGWQSEMSVGCYNYKWRRASQDCVGYQPPNSSVVFGDPHIITFDGFEYSFNAVGEFSLLRVHEPAHDLDIQGRFEQYVDGNRKLKLPASILTSVVAKDNESIPVEIQLRPSEARWRYRLNVLADGKRIYFDRPAQKIQTFKGVTVYSPSNVQNQSHIVTMFQSGAGVEVLENGGYMSVRVYLPRTFMNITRGLLGNWSWDPEDDLAFPKPTEEPPLSTTTSFEQIYKTFGLRWMLSDSGSAGIAGTKSYFTHENTRSTGFYNKPEFNPDYKQEPLFRENMTMTLREVDQVCGSRSDPRNYQCRYDFLITENREFAQMTKFNADGFRTMRDRELILVTTCGALETPRYGRKSTNKYTINTEVKFECEKGYILEGEPTRWCYPSGEWSWVEYGRTRCLPEDDYSARQAGITTGIVLGILIPVIIGAICLFGFIMSKKNEYGGSTPPYMTRGESHELDVRTDRDNEKPKRQRDSDA